MVSTQACHAVRSLVTTITFEVIATIRSYTVTLILCLVIIPSMHCPWTDFVGKIVQLHVTFFPS